MSGRRLSPVTARAPSHATLPAPLLSYYSLYYFLLFRALPVPCRTDRRLLPTCVRRKEVRRAEVQEREKDAASPGISYKLLGCEVLFLV